MLIPRTGFLGKYRLLLLATLSFFLLSVGIFGLNYVLSLQMSGDAAAINDSGRLRGFSQQSAKAMLILAQEVAAAGPTQSALAEISESLLGQNEVLARARRHALEGHDAEETALLDKFAKSWDPLALLASDLLETAAAAQPQDAERVDAARARSNAINVRLMQVADDLTAHLERSAQARTERFKQIQALAIALASANFLFIVIYALRSLARSERVAAAAKKETGQILGTVREGLFLIGRDGRIGSVRSAHLEQIFPRPPAHGARFSDVLAPLVPDEILEAVNNYVGLLFNRRVKATLIASLNPLNRIEVRNSGPDNASSRFLDFNFSPVTGSEDGGHDERDLTDDADDVRALLVSVVDVSEQVRLERQLESAEERARSEMGLLLGVLENDPAEVAQFLAGAAARLDDMNTLLRDLDPQATRYSEVIATLFRVVHGIKGEAAALALGPLTHQAHQFEDTLCALRRQALAGADLIPVATGVGQMQQVVAKVARITERIRAVSGQTHPATPADTADDVQHSVQRIARLALSIAADLGKRVRVETSLAASGELPAPIRQLLHEGLPQLVRNALVHGIEPAHERLRDGKLPEGLIRIEYTRSESGTHAIAVIDDGRGIDIAALRAKLVAAGRCSAPQAAAMPEREVVALLFEPGFSTASAVTEHAGRGVGLDTLLALARRTGARLRVASTAQKSTRFTLQWSLAA